MVMNQFRKLLAKVNLAKESGSKEIRLTLSELDLLVSEITEELINSHERQNELILLLKSKVNANVSNTKVSGGTF